MSLLVEDQAGSMGRIGLALASLGVGVASVTASLSEDGKASRMTLQISVAPRMAPAIAKELEVLEGVLRCAALTPSHTLHRELGILDVCTERESRARVIELASVFRARLISVEGEFLRFEALGMPEEIEALHELLRDFGTVRMVRSGLVCMPRTNEPILV